MKAKTTVACCVGVAVAAVVAVACGTTAPPLDGGADASEEIDCSAVGCAMSPGCGQVCTAVCGCCGCPYGATCGTCDAGPDGTLSAARRRAAGPARP